MIVTRKPSACAICLKAIAVGARVRAQTQVSREQWKAMTFRFCPAYCEAMAVAADDREPIYARTAIGMETATKRRSMA